MARAFSRSSLQFGKYAGAAASAFPITMAGWFYPTDLTTGRSYAIATINEPGANEYLVLFITENGGSFKVAALARATGGSENYAYSSTSPTVNAWNHVGVVFGSTTSRAAYLNGGSKGTNATSMSALSIVSKTCVGAFDYTGSTVHAVDGRIGEVGVWSVALDDAEMASLAAGFSPLLIRPQSLVAYYPLVGNDSPEPDRWRNRYDLTLTASPTKADHPRIYYPSGALYPFVAPSATTVSASPIIISTSLPTVVTIPSLATPLHVTGALNAAVLAAYQVVSPLTLSGSLPTARLIGEFDVTVLINGSHRHAYVLPHEGTAWSTLTTSEALNDEPDTATFTVKGFTPSYGQPVEIAHGFTKLFGGTIATCVQRNVGSRDNVEYDLSCVDWTRLLNRRLVNAAYTTETVYDILLDLIADYGSGFTTVNVDSALDALTLDGGITFTDEPLAAAIARVMKRAGGYYYVDPDRDVHAFLEDSVGGPDAVTDLTTPEIERLSIATDVNQVRTRVFVEGGGSACPIVATVGLASIPVVDGIWYDLVAGGLVKLGQNRASYTHGNAGGGGALVGTLLNPTTAPVATARIGAGLGAGVYAYAVTFYDGTGETTPGPNAAYTSGTAIAAPASTPTLTKLLGGNLGAGVYQYAVTYVDSAGGETTASSIASLTLDQVTAPTTPDITGSPSPGGANALTASAVYSYKATFADSPYETEAGPASATFTALSGGNHGEGKILKSSLGTPATSFHINLYRTEGNGSTYKLVNPLYIYDDGTYLYESSFDVNLGAAAPSSSAATYRQVSLTGIPVSPDANVTSRKIYRTVAGGSQLKLLATIANNSATTYSDNTADGSLGANVPVTNTALYKQTTITSIPVGPTGTTGRKLYRTAVGGSQLKLLTTLANNSATTYTDSTADGSLGANVPTSNTSGLASQTGTVNAGSTTLPVSGVGAFTAGGGWALVGGQYVRYTGLTSSSLTGIPSTGAGALASTVNYSTEILAVPSLQGIPTSGTGAIDYAVPAGEAVNVLAQADDAAAQAILAALEGGDGIHEYAIQDNRLSLDSATVRADAELALFKRAIVSVAYETHDPLTRAGKLISFDLGNPTNLTGDFLIQRVTRSEFTGLPNSYPRVAVEASNVKFSLEDLLRRVRVEQSA